MQKQKIVNGLRDIKSKLTDIQMNITYNHSNFEDVEDVDLGEWNDEKFSHAWVALDIAIDVIDNLISKVYDKPKK